jgi:hypothetical protein
MSFSRSCSNVYVRKLLQIDCYNAAVSNGTQLGKKKYVVVKDIEVNIKERVCEEGNYFQVHDFRLPPRCK